MDRHNPLPFLSSIRFQMLSKGLRYHHRFDVVLAPLCGGDEGANPNETSSFRHDQASPAPARPGRLSTKSPRKVLSGKEDEEFLVEAETAGASARELNRTLLSALRKVGKRTTLRGERTFDHGPSERFFDYVL